MNILRNMFRFNHNRTFLDIIILMDLIFAKQFPEDLQIRNDDTHIWIYIPFVFSYTLPFLGK